ncbi:hypothetical protein F7725_006670 [Dissostichus mawsoni]|uniref:Uncharacterized protein n=1 Tax=Dissostichus mawsoni TaxID=36200 RepID=A0A7J5XXC9_DISMA|nr:hypothetical protein F7725_006670 [Dissostichus mawsoni]
MASSEGVFSLIFSTLRHLAKSAPSFLYCAQRSESPSRPAAQHMHRTIVRNQGGSIVSERALSLTPTVSSVYLDADNNATVLDELGEVSAVVCVLVKGFMEEDDPSDTAVDALVGCEEQLAVATPVLLCVLNPNGVQTLPHAACVVNTTLLMVGLKKTCMISALRHEETTADSLSCGVVENPPELHVEEHTNNLQLNALHRNQV